MTEPPEPVAAVLRRLLETLRPKPRLMLLPKREEQPHAERQERHENGGRDDSGAHASALPLVDAANRARWAGRS